MIIMEKGQIYIGIGLILNSLGILLREFEIYSMILPEHIKCFTQGFFTSLGIVLILYGCYYERHNFNFKKKIYNKMIGSK